MISSGSLSMLPTSGAVLIGGDDLGNRHGPGHPAGQCNFDGARGAVAQSAEDVLLAGVGDELDVVVPIAPGQWLGLLDAPAREYVVGEPGGGARVQVHQAILPVGCS
nr:hypothetical protein [Kibdelosporangium sp. MJ126-NF4]